jgi:plasmid stabilization system protein ParE
MNWVVILRPLADDDVREIVLDLNARLAGLGQRFLFRLRERLTRLESNPELYGVIWRDVRAVRVKKFNYIVYFVILPPNRVEVLAVLHGHQRASAWRDRAD